MDRAATVIIASNNRYPMLRQTVCSAYLNRGRNDTQILVWDNASTDETGPFLDKFAADNPELHVYHSRKHHWMRAYGMAAVMVKTHYVILMEDDILWHDENYDGKLIDLIEAAPELGLISTNVLQSQWGTHGRPAPWEANETWEMLNTQLYVGPHLDAWCSVTPKQMLLDMHAFVTDPVGMFSHKGEQRGSPGSRYIVNLWSAGKKTAWARSPRVVHGSDVPWNLEFGCGDILKGRMTKVDWDYKIESMRRCPYLSERFRDFLAKEPPPQDFNEPAWENLQNHLKRLRADGDYVDRFELAKRF